MYICYSKYIIKSIYENIQQRTFDLNSHGIVSAKSLVFSWWNSWRHKPKSHPCIMQVTQVTASNRNDSGPILAHPRNFNELIITQVVVAISRPPFWYIFENHQVGVSMLVFRIFQGCIISKTWQTRGFRLRRFPYKTITIWKVTSAELRCFFFSLPSAILVLALLLLSTSGEKKIGIHSCSGVGGSHWPIL